MMLASSYELVHGSKTGCGRPLKNVEDHDLRIEAEQTTVCCVECLELVVDSLVAPIVDVLRVDEYRKVFNQDSLKGVYGKCYCSLLTLLLYQHRPRLI